MWTHIKGVSVLVLFFFTVSFVLLGLNSIYDLVKDYFSLETRIEITKIIKEYSIISPVIVVVIYIFHILMLLLSSLFNKPKFNKYKKLDIDLYKNFNHNNPYVSPSEF